MSKISRKCVTVVQQSLAFQNYTFKSELASFFPVLAGQPIQDVQWKIIAIHQ
jgi:hypothetical protein